MTNLKVFYVPYCDIEYGKFNFLIEPNTLGWRQRSVKEVYFTVNSTVRFKAYPGK